MNNTRLEEMIRFGRLRLADRRSSEERRKNESYTFFFSQAYKLLGELATLVDWEYVRNHWSILDTFPTYPAEVRVAISPFKTAGMLVKFVFQTGPAPKWSLAKWDTLRNGSFTYRVDRLLDRTDYTNDPYEAIALASEYQAEIDQLASKVSATDSPSIIALFGSGKKSYEFAHHKHDDLLKPHVGGEGG